MATAVAPLNPLASIEAKIQSKVARFLLLKEPLLRLSSRSTNLDTRSTAAGLLANQTSLEIQLKEALEKIEEVKRGVYTYSDVIDLGYFAYSFDKHIGEAEELIKASRGEQVTPSKLELVAPGLIFFGIGLAALKALRIL